MNKKLLSLLFLLLCITFVSFIFIKIKTMGGVSILNLSIMTVSFLITCMPVSFVIEKLTINNKTSWKFYWEMMDLKCVVVWWVASTLLFYIMNEFLKLKLDNYLVIFSIGAGIMVNSLIVLNYYKKQEVNN